MKQPSLYVFPNFVLSFLLVIVYSTLLITNYYKMIFSFQHNLMIITRNSVLFTNFKVLFLWLQIPFQSYHIIFVIHLSSSECRFQSQHNESNQQCPKRTLSIMDLEKLYQIKGLPSFIIRNLPFLLSIWIRNSPFLIRSLLLCLS